MSLKKVKILFKYFSNVLDEITVETMWANVINEREGIYKLNNIPFYGPLIAPEDEFHAEYDETEEILTYRRTTKSSGNSVILVIITKEGYDKEILRNEFKELNCISEGVNDKYFSMEIAKEVNYSSIKSRLDAYEVSGLIEYAEPCLSEKHQEDINN